MERDAFAGGVEPGGLWNKNDIRILICYILNSVRAPLSDEDICSVLQGKSLANYFESVDALSALERLGNVEKNADGLYTLTDSGREIADNLDAILPLSVRDKALEAALTRMADVRARRENKVDIEPTDNGFRVTCRILGDESSELMSVSLYVPDRAQASFIEERFFKNPSAVYKLLISALTGDMELASSFFEENG